MLFNSLAFLLFFPVVTFLYYALPHRFRWQLLLVCSCYFYMYFVPKYILILFLLIGIDYLAGLAIEKAEGQKRKLFLVISLLSNLSLLGYFKYFNFFSANVGELCQFLHLNYAMPTLQVVLPIGLSFHTFQAMAYTIEVYRGHQKAETHLGIYALYVLFYPQMVAGPIERPQNLLHQFKDRVTLDYTNLSRGLRLMGWGLFKKMAVADQIGPIVNTVYEAPRHYGGGTLMAATLIFSLQIYCDFSGYSDVARGAARCLGVELMRNFARPYLATSIADFWKRWHISLSTWFRDYLYIPLGGNRVSKPRHYVNLVLVFLVSGLWHGASWCFVIWGAVHGTYLILEQLLGVEAVPQGRAMRLLRTLLTFALVTLAWVFFRAPSVDVALYIIVNMFLGWGGTASAGLRLFNIEWFGIIGSIVFLLVVELTQERRSVDELLSRQSIVVRWLIYYALIAWTLVFGLGQSLQFLYFQF